MKKQYSKVIKIVIQILFFLWIPESFAASLYAVKKLIHAVSVMDFTYAREPVLLLLETVEQQRFSDGITADISVVLVRHRI